MNATATAIPEVLIFEPEQFSDERGGFFESFNHQKFARATGLEREFVQDNHSISMRHVLRGLHYQLRQPQGKLIRTIRGEIFDVAVDLRRHSPTLGHWVGVTLSDSNRRQLWVPEGFGHGFFVTSDIAEVLYKTTAYYSPADERTILWEDQELAINWPYSISKVLSARDLAGAAFARAQLYP